MIPDRFFLVCVGGAIGTGARYALGTWVARTFGAVFPYGTLAINLVGSFLIVIIMGLSLQKGIIPADVRLILTTGVMGGFTTYSSFNYEALRLFEQGSRGFALIYLGATVIGCLILGSIASVLVRLVPGG